MAADGPASSTPNCAAIAGSSAWWDAAGSRPAKTSQAARAASLCAVLRLKKSAMSASRARNDARSSRPAAASGWSATWASASVAPHEPPTTSQRGTARCRRSRRRSASRWAVLLWRVAPAGWLAPAPRWSRQITRYSAASKPRRSQGAQPEPGPPCNTSTGRPSARPCCVNNSRWPPGTAQVSRLSSGRSSATSAAGPVAGLAMWPGAGWGAGFGCMGGMAAGQRLCLARRW